MNIQLDGSSPWEEGEEKQEGSRAAAAAGSVGEAGGYSNACRCDLLFWQVHCTHVQHHYMLRVHLPKHWFHMVLETGYKHLRHQMKSVSERRKWLGNSFAWREILGFVFEPGCASEAVSCFQFVPVATGPSSSEQQRARYPVKPPWQSVYGFIFRRQWSVASAESNIITNIDSIWNATSGMKYFNGKIAWADWNQAAWREKGRLSKTREVLFMLCKWWSVHNYVTTH